MAQIRINPQLVSHIKIYDFTSEDYFYCPRKKYPDILFGLIKGIEYKEGYYRDGEQNYITKEYYYLSKEKIKKSRTSVDINGELFTKPRVIIFAQKENITTKYFNSLNEAKEYCNINFPNVNIYVEKD